MRFALLALALLAAGCATPAATPEGPPAAAGDPAQGRLAFVAPVALPHRGSIAWEPGLRVTDDDRVYVTAFVGHFWRSQDGGATFDAPLATRCLAPAPACPPPLERPDGLATGSDGAIGIDSRGRIHWAGLGSSTTPPPSVPYQRSDDGGATWTAPLDLAGGHDADRQWLAITPDDAIHVVWRDAGPRAIPILRQGIEGPDHILISSSRDGGSTWTPPRPIFEPAPIPGPLVASRSGALYVPVSRDGLQLLRSLDGGLTWTTHPIAPPGPGSGPGLEHFVFPWIGVDDAETLYAVWAEDADAAAPGPRLATRATMVPRVHFTVSRDQGETWASPVTLSPEGRAAIMPTLAAGAAGRVVVAWYESLLDGPGEKTPQAWHVVVAVSVNAAEQTPLWDVAPTTQEPAHVGPICTAGGTCTDHERSRGDFFEVQIRPNGLPIVAYVRDRTPDASMGDHEVVVARATHGPRLR